MRLSGECTGGQRCNVERSKAAPESLQQELFFCCLSLLANKYQARSEREFATFIWSFFASFPTSWGAAVTAVTVMEGGAGDTAAGTITEGGAAMAAVSEGATLKEGGKEGRN